MTMNPYATVTPDEAAAIEADEFEKYADDQIALSYAKGGFPDLADYRTGQGAYAPAEPNLGVLSPNDSLGSWSGPPTARGAAPGVDFQMAQRDQGVAAYNASRQGLEDWRVANIPNYVAQPTNAMQSLQQNQAGRPLYIKDVTGGGGTGFVYPEGVGPVGEPGQFEQGPPLMGPDGQPIEGTVDPNQASIFRGADGRWYTRREAPLAGAEGLYSWRPQPTAEEAMARMPSGWDYAPAGYTPDQPYSEYLTVFPNGNFGYRPGGSDQWVQVDLKQPGLSDPTNMLADVAGLAPGNYYRPQGLGPLEPWRLYNTDVPQAAIGEAPPMTGGEPPVVSGEYGEVPAEASGEGGWEQINYSDNSQAWFNQQTLEGRREWQNGDIAWFDPNTGRFSGYNAATGEYTYIDPGDPKWQGVMQAAFPRQLASGNFSAAAASESPAEQPTSEYRDYGNEVLNAVAQAAGAHSIPPEYHWIPMTVVYGESGLNPRAVGDNGASVGPYMMHERGKGAGYTFEQRADPYFSSEVMMPYFAASIAKHAPTAANDWDLLTKVWFDVEAPANIPQVWANMAAAYKWWMG